MSQLYGFTARDCDRLHALLAAYEQGRIRVDVPAISRSNSHQQDSFLGSTSGTITAGHTGTATMVDLDTAIPPGQTTLTTVPTLPVFNPSTSDLPAGTYLFTLEPSQGYYIPSFAGGSSLTVEDGTTTVNNVTTLKFKAGSVSSPTGGEADVAAIYGGAAYGSTGQVLTTSFATLSGFSMPLPAAGTYLIWGGCPVTVSVETNGTLQYGWVVLYDITATSQFGQVATNMFGGNVSLAGQQCTQTLPLFGQITVTGANTIGIQGSCGSTGALNNFMGADLNSGGTSGVAWLSYLRVG